MLEILPPKEYQLIFLENIYEDLFFRVTRNKKTKMIYPEYSKNGMWRNFGTNNLSSIPTGENNSILKDKDVAKIFQEKMPKIRTICIILAGKDD